MAEAARPDITAGLVLGECNTGRLHVRRAKRGTPFRAGDGSVLLEVMKRYEPLVGARLRAVQRTNG
jgi:hypothetical protein